MSEQTANLCTTDACESLRARLAKYEDAEGRPARLAYDESWRLIKNKELRNVERLRSLSNHLLQCAHCAVKPDISIDGSGKILMFHDCLAFENRRIVKVSGDDKHIINTWENLTFPPEEEKTYNIAALKTKPSGLVLPEREAVIMKAVGMCNRIPGSTNWNAAEFAYDEFVARLNSSPVSSAPSQGEQVLGLLTDSMRLLEELAFAGELELSCQKGAVISCACSDCMTDRAICVNAKIRALLAAAPSAVSQEQGE